MKEQAHFVGLFFFYYNSRNGVSIETLEALRKIKNTVLTKGS